MVQDPHRATIDSSCNKFPANLSLASNVCEYKLDASITCLYCTSIGACGVHAQALKQSLWVSRVWVHACICNREAQSSISTHQQGVPTLFHMVHLNNSNRIYHKISLYIISHKLPVNYFNWIVKLSYDEADFVILNSAVLYFRGQTE